MHTGPETTPKVPQSQKKRQAPNAACASRASRFSRGPLAVRGRRGVCMLSASRGQCEPGAAERRPRATSKHSLPPAPASARPPSGSAGTKRRPNPGFLWLFQKIFHGEILPAESLCGSNTDGHEGHRHRVLAPRGAKATATRSPSLADTSRASDTGAESLNSAPHRVPITYAG